MRIRTALPALCIFMACANTTEPGDSAAAIAGSYAYSAVISDSPDGQDIRIIGTLDINGDLSGWLTVKVVLDDVVQGDGGGTLCRNYSDGRCANERATVHGQTLSFEVGRSCQLAPCMRHDGTIAGDTIRGTWQNASVPMNGTFIAVRQ